MYVPVTTTPTAAGLTCPTCGTRLTWVPAAPAVDAREPFQQFDVQVLQPDGTHRRTTIHSLHQLRQIERDCETRHANGEGQRMVFRAWAQDRGNLGVSALGEAPSARPDPAWVRKHGRAIRSAVEPDVTFGPGVDPAAVSALPAAPAQQE